ncbi:hypothetical protein BDV12DRAFT_185006 [Aspergillus spectabilis]
MRLHLTIQRHGLPVTRILWTTSPPSLYGHNQPNPSSIIPATSTAVTSSRVSNALYANGGYTVAQLLEDVNEVIPLETEARLFEDQSSGQWGLEDYVVEVGGSECLHFMELEGLLRDGDEVLIRALQISDLRARRLSGRHQISNDGKHLIDGVPFGKPFLKRPTSSRPAIMIPPRKKRRTALAIWGSGSNYEEEDTEWAPPQYISTGKELSLLNPASELEKEDEEEFEDAYRDDYEDYHEPNEEGDGTVIRHDIDKTNEPPDSDDDTPDSEPEDLSQELQELKKDMQISVLPESEQPGSGLPLSGHSLRSRPSAVKAAPRKSSLSRRSIRLSSDGDSSRRDSKSVTFQNKNKTQKKLAPNFDTLIPRAGSTSEEPEASVSSDSSSSASDSSDSKSSDEDSSSDESVSAPEAESASSPDSESNSSSESSDSDSESEQEEVSIADNVLKPSHEVNPPGAGSQRTKKSNQRGKMRRRLTKLKELGILGDDADFAALREWESKNGDAFNIPDIPTDEKKREQEEFEAKRRKLLRDLESGGVDISYLSEKENVSPKSAGPDTSQLDNDEHYETANDINDATPEVPKRRTLDVSSTRRLLFGSLGVRTPRSKEEEDDTRKKLAGKERKSIPREPVQTADESIESEPEVDWREKLILGATECVYDDIELSTPPFPFEQHWDAEAGFLIRQRKGWGKKRKRKQRLQVYDEETAGDGDDYYVEDDLPLNYDDAEQPEAETGHKAESEQTATKTVQTPEDDLPKLPSDTDGLPDLAADDLKPGLVFVFKQLDVSKATNWQPEESDYRVAVVNEVFDSNIVSIQLAKPYRKQPRDIDDENPFQYSGFEMPGMDEDEEDNGIREVPFDELRAPKLLRAAPAADAGDAGDKDTASIFPADDEQPAQEASQFAFDVSATSEHDQLAEKSPQQPATFNDKYVPTSRPLLCNDSPIRSPRFEGFELSQACSSPLSNPPFSASCSIASSGDPYNEQQTRASPKENNVVQSQLPSSCPPNADDHDLQETGLTEQLQTIGSPASVISLSSYNGFMNFILTQDVSSPVKGEKMERKRSPDAPNLETSSPTGPNPFYEIDKAHEERRRRSRTKQERGRSYDSASSRKRSPKMAPPPSSKPRQKQKSPSPMQEISQETSQVSVIPDSVRPEKEPSPPASQTPEFMVDLTQSSPPVSPGGSDEDFAKTHRLPRGSGWVQKSTRRQTRQSSSSSRVIRTLEDSTVDQLDLGLEKS